MIRILLLSLLALFCLKNNELSAKTKGPSASEIKAAEATIAAQANGKTRVTIKTSAGTVEVMLYDETPLHRDNFLRHIENKTYNGVIFHRVIRDFMMQAGDPTSKNTMATATYGSNSAGEPVPAEIDPRFFHHKGALAAARTGDDVNPERKSSGSQFYIVQGEIHTDSTLNAQAERIRSIIPFERVQVYKTLGGVPRLDGAYTIFGRVTKGMKVVDKICSVPTDYKDRPRRDIFIKSMTVKTVKK